MKNDNELKSWERFCHSGSVSDYIAYRQFVNRRAEHEAVGEAKNSAADHRGDSDKRETIW